MKNLLLASLVFIISACNTTPAVELPVPLYTDGTNFVVPCAEHGSHLQTIKSHSIGVIYTIENDQGQVADIPEAVIVQLLEMFGIVPNVP